MKVLIIGAGPLGSLYTYLLHKAGKDVTLFARNEHYAYLKENGLTLINEFTQERITENVNIVNFMSKEDGYDLLIVLMRKNSIKDILPLLRDHDQIPNFLFMGNNTLGFEEYLKYIPKEKVLFGFPGGGGSRIDHVAHYIDSEKPNGKRMHAAIGEIDGETRERTNQIRDLFETSGVPVNIIDDMDGWLKYHVAFVNPLAGALLKAGDNYKLAKDKDILRTYIRAVKEGGRVLKALGFRKSYNPKLNMFYWVPEVILIYILGKVFSTRFAEIAMMMHVKAAGDEMMELGNDFKTLTDRTTIKTPNLDELISCINY